MRFFNLLKSARANATLSVMSKGVIRNLAVSQMPESIGKFMGTNDMWVEVNFPKEENVTSCIYKAKKGSVFNPHKHEKSSEHCVILNSTGKIKAITRQAITIVEYPNGVTFSANQPHAIVFLEDTEVLVMWRPRMVKEWSAEFIDTSKDEK